MHRLTAHTYMAQAVHNIDEVMGDGYAKKHPDVKPISPPSRLLREIRK